MTSDRLNWFLTVAANIGVVVGLCFLAVELRQNTLSTQATLHMNLMSYGREHAELLISDDSLGDLVIRGEKDPGSLTALEREKFLLFTSWRMGVWETAYLNHREGVMGERYWNVWDPWYSEIVRGGPGYVFWWKQARHGYDLGFRAHVEDVLEAASDERGLASP
jgi:hypothetical protein